MIRQIFLLIESKKIFSNNFFICYQLNELDFETLKTLGLELEVKEKNILLLKDLKCKKLYYLYLNYPRNDFFINFRVLALYEGIVETDWLEEFKIENTFDIYSLYQFFQFLKINFINDKNLYRDGRNNIYYIGNWNQSWNGVMAVDNYIENTILKEKGVESNVCN